MNSSTFLVVVNINSILFSFCVLGLSHLATVAMPHENQTDWLALQAFKAKITDDPLRSLSSWNESIHFCQWHGVTCESKNERVIMLDLQHQKLGGTLSPYIGNLSFLRQLFLDNNSFTGEIPMELGRLQTIEYLWLRNNSFGGKVPTNLSACSSLIDLRFSWNNLIGKIPSDFGSLKSLKIIQIPRNNLSGSIPTSFGNLSSLSFLGFSSNNLVGSIPNELGQLTKLDYIGLAQNRLSGEFPPTVFNISSITRIFVIDNQIQGSLPTDLGLRWPNISYLGISGNKFIGSIPASVSNMSNLEKLFLGQNKLNGRVPTFEKLIKILNIDISGNELGSGQFNDLAFISSLTNASNLKQLGLSNNYFGGFLPESFGNLSTKLEGLLLGYNQLSGSIPNWVAKFVNLTIIDITNNHFTGEIPSAIVMLPKLQVLRLSNNKLSGKIPYFLGNLSLLLELDLSDNNFHGEIPTSLEKCQNLLSLNISLNNLTGVIPTQLCSLSSLSSYLDLSHNQLTGSLPMEVGNLKNLGELDVSMNMLTGEIPSTLGVCVRLEKLDIKGNLLSGTIPSSVRNLRGLQFFDLSRNNFSGQIPEYLEDFDLKYLNLSFNDFEGVLPREGIFKNTSAISVIGNPKLCGGITELQLPQCNHRRPRNITSTFTFKLMISIVSGVLGLCLILGFIFLYSYTRTKDLQSSDLSGCFLLKVSYHILSQATDGFCSSTLIGVGGSGSVYKGILDNGIVVAVKILDLSHHGASKSFMAECEALRNIRHRNLVRILSACSGADNHGNDFMALVYEFMENGSLEEWLHPNSDEDFTRASSKKLNLLQRLSIAIDVASALDYLHYQCGTTTVHCDLKPSNVLLDSELVGHVADFGLARIIPKETEVNYRNQASSSVVKGTIGYTAPEYAMGSVASTYGDVYSFGILLLEMFTGKKPTDDMFKDDLNLHNFAEEALPDRLSEIIDPILLQQIEWKTGTRNTEVHQISGSQNIKNCLHSIFEVGVACSATLATERMNICDAAVKLHSVKEYLA